MRHRKKANRLGRPLDQRKALLRNLLSSLVISEKIKTTKTKAKELSRFADKTFTGFRKKDDVSGIRFLNSIFYKKDVSKKFNEINQRLSDINSGFTRTTSIKHRDGDSAEIVQIEFVK